MNSRIDLGVERSMIHLIVKQPIRHIIPIYMHACCVCFNFYCSTANVVNMAMLVAMCVLCMWIYVRYTGEHREWGVSIDDVAESLWDGVSDYCLLIQNSC